MPGATPRIERFGPRPSRTAPRSPPCGIRPCDPSSLRYSTLHAGLRKARRLLSRPPVRPRHAGARQGLAALRFARPGHPRGVRGHDRQRQDRVVPLTARGGGDRQGSRHRHRPEGRPRQPAAHLPRASARGLPALGQSGRCAPEGREHRGVRRPAGGTVEEGAGRVGRRRRSDRAAARRRRFRHLHAGQRGRVAGVDPAVALRTPRRRRRRMPSCSASGSRPP